jgi:Fe-S-cluster containining protein
MTAIADTDLRETWTRLRQPCPMLTTEGQCGAYRARPYACATYVVREGPSACAPDETRIVSSPDTRAIEFHVFDRALRLAQDNDWPVRIYLGLATAITETVMWLRANKHLALDAEASGAVG